MLVDNSLVRRWASGRLGMLETISEFALEELEDSGEAENLRRRHAEHFLVLAESSNLSIDSVGPENHGILEHEGGNVRAALEWALASGELELGIRLAVALEGYWIARNPFEGMRWFSLLLEHEEELASELRARAFGAWGGATSIVGRLEEGIRLLEESLSLYRQLGDERGVGAVLATLAHTSFSEGDTARARSLAEESMELFKRTADRESQAVALGALGEVELAEGNHDRGLELIAEGIAIAREIGFSSWVAVDTSMLADRAAGLGRWEEAERWAREAVSESHAIGERQFLLFDLALLARAAAQAGRVERAGTLWGAIETEEARGPVGQWETEREEYAAAVLEAAGPDFERGRAAGRALTLDEVVEYALADT